MARTFAFASVASLVVLLCGASSAVKAQTTLFCAAVFVSFSPCMTFVGDLSSEPMVGCCDSINALNSIAKADEPAGGPQMICQCIENSSYWTDVPFNASRIQELPIRCQLHLSFPISNSMDCFKV